MFTPETIDSKEIREISIEEAVTYLTNEKRDPVLQVLGEYIRAAEGGDLNQEKVLVNIQKHLLDIGGFYGNFDVHIFFDNDLGYPISSSISRVSNAIKNLPDEVKTFLEKYSGSLNSKIKQTYQETVNSDQVYRVLGVLSNLLYRNHSTNRSLKQYEKDRFVREQFQKKVGVPFNGNLDAQNPVYRQALKQAEFMSKDEISPQNERVSLTELINTYMNLLKELNDEVMFRLDSNYNPFTTTISQDFQFTSQLPFSKNSFSVVLTDHNKKKSYDEYHLGILIESLQLSQPDFYLEARSRLSLINVLLRYIDNYHDKDKLSSQLEKIKSIIDNPLKHLTENVEVDFNNQPSTYLGSFIKWLQITEKHVLQDNETKEGMFGKPKKGLEILSNFIKKLQNEGIDREIFSDFSLTDKELTDFLSVFKSIFDVKVSLSGNPLHVVRFPQVVSFFSEENIRNSSTFIDYRQFIANKDLQTKVQVKNHLSFVPQNPEDNFIYLALPQYAPIAEITLSIKDEEENISLTEGEDYIVQYEPKSGHYRVVIISEKADLAKKNGINYLVGIDFIDRQKDVPKKVNTVSLSSEKVKKVSKSLEEAGFGRLANKLQSSLRPSIFEQIKLQFSQKEFEYSSDQLAHAIRESVYYSFATESSEEVSLAANIVSNSVDAELDFSFLPQVSADKAFQARIRVQCRHVAKLYSQIFNYLLIDDKDNVGSVYDSSLFKDPTYGVTGMMGFRFFSAGHADNRGIFQNSNKGPLRFEQDLTPGLSTETIIDAARSTLTSIQQIVLRLKEVKKSLDGELSFTDQFYIEIHSNEQNFDQYIRELKRETAQYSRVFGDKQNDLDNFVKAEPGIYRPASELIEIMKTKPLSAILNIILSFQDHGTDFIHQKNEIVQIKKILFMLSEWFDKAKSQANTQEKTRETDRIFLDELNSASRIGKKLLALIDSVENNSR